MGVVSIFCDVALKFVAKAIGTLQDGDLSSHP